MPTFSGVGIVILGNGVFRVQEFANTNTQELTSKVESQVTHCNGWAGSGAIAASEEETRRSNMRHRPVGLGVQGDPG